MYVSTDWIKDFVDLPDMLSQDLAVKFTMATCEVEEVIVHEEFLTKITTVEVLSKKKHPEADTLNLVTIKISDSETKEIVCGAPNVEPGIKVPYACLGTTFPNGLTLTPKKIRGIVSEGMLCSEAELEIGDDASKLLVLPEETPIGITMAEQQKIENVKPDIILDIDNKSITHRPDLWGHYGMAREFSLVFDKPLKRPFTEEWKNSLRAKFTNDPSPIVPVVEEDSCNLAYYGIAVDNITIGESPAWMQQRLKVCGLRPINNIVDISNYVMLELGIPNHIFDRTRIKDEKIIVRPLKEAEQFETLDEIKRDLIAGDTVVADSEKPLVIAGIMGGDNSGVLDSTTSIFIECANWKDSEVRKTSARLGLRTDSSQRYEKSLDSELLEITALRALELVLELCPNATVRGKLESAGKEVTPREPLKIAISEANICKTLGKEVSSETINHILTGLDFTVAKENDNLVVTVPSFRATKDIECEADIIEEIGRIVGYDNITPESPLDKILPIRLSIAKQLHRNIQDFMIYHGRALEVLTYPMIGEALLKKAEWETLNEELQLVNALSQDHERMRPSLIPSALQAAALNHKNYPSFSFFELGRSYQSDHKNFSQDRNQLLVAFYDKKESRFMELVNIIERLLNRLNIPAVISEANPKHPNLIVNRDWRGLHPYETLDIKIMGKNNGIITTVHPMMCNNFKIKGNLALAVIDLRDFEERPMKDKTSYKPLPKYPSSDFDCTVIAQSDDTADKILDVLKRAKIKHAESIKIADIFVRSAEEKAVTVRTTLCDPDKTLTSEFIDETKNKIVAALDKAGFPLKM